MRSHTLLALLLTVAGACGSDPDSAADSAIADTAIEDSSGGGDADDTSAPDTGTPDTSGDAADTVASDFDAGPEPCDEVNAFTPVYAEAVARWSAQDDAGGWPEGPVVFTGSSSVRRWEGLAAAYTDYAPLQRGIGGAQVAEIAYYAETLITRHDPRAVVVYAGTNDISAGVAVDTVIERLRCLRWRIGSALGWDRPLLLIGITPNPARWGHWGLSEDFNEAAAALAASDPALTFIDVATPFLAQGSPPPDELFVSDGLHLSDSGYALWDSVIRPAVEAAVSPRPAVDAPSPALAAGTIVRVDLGPDDDVDGEATPSPDYLGHHWNNWRSLAGGGAALPGEQLVDLVTTSGTATGIDLVIAGGFLSNGRRNGGLLWPDESLLGDLAVGGATGDYFYTDGPDNPGALFLRGLDPDASYTVRLFAAREGSATRRTRYTVTGAGSASGVLQTSGDGAGHADVRTNDDDIVTFAGVKPDAWGHVFVDVAIEEGAYGYLAILELTVE